MTVHIGWLVQDRVLDLEISDSYTRADLEQINDVLSPIVAQDSEDAVYILGDTTNMESINFSPRELVNVLSFLNSARFRCLVGYGVKSYIKPFAELMGQVVSSATGTEVVFVDDRETAIQQLQAMDSTLNLHEH